MTRNTDPTRDEMLAVMVAFDPSMDEFDYEEAMYWFANDWHSGQWSNLYAALCASLYKPGPLTNGCDPDGVSAMLYAELEAAFTVGKE